MKVSETFNNDSIKPFDDKVSDSDSIKYSFFFVKANNGIKFVDDEVSIRFDVDCIWLSTRRTAPLGWLTKLGSCRNSSSDEVVALFILSLSGGALSVLLLGEMEALIMLLSLLLSWLSSDQKKSCYDYCCGNYYLHCFCCCN